MRNAMGPYDPPQSAFAAIPLPATQEASAQLRLDTRTSTACGIRRHIPKTADDVDSWVAPRTPHFGTGGATEIGANKTPFFQDQACTLALGSFNRRFRRWWRSTTRPSSGAAYLCLLKGAHEEVEQFFRMQRNTGGVVGPEGLSGWPAAVAGRGQRRAALDAHAPCDPRPVHRRRTAIPVPLRRSSSDEGDAVIAFARVSPWREHQRGRRSAL